MVAQRSLPRYDFSPAFKAGFTEHKII